MPAAPLFAEDCNSNDICELFIGAVTSAGAVTHIKPAIILVPWLRHILQDAHASGFSQFQKQGQDRPMFFLFCLLSSYINKSFYYSVFNIFWSLGPGHARYNTSKTAQK